MPIFDDLGKITHHIYSRLSTIAINQRSPTSNKSPNETAEASDPEKRKTRSRTDVVTDILASKDVNNGQQRQIIQNSNPDEILKSLKDGCVYESTGIRTVTSEQIHNALLTIAATSVETERALLELFLWNVCC